MPIQPAESAFWVFLSIALRSISVAVYRPKLCDQDPDYERSIYRREITLIVINKLFVNEEKHTEFEDFINDRMEFIRNSDCLSYSFERPTGISMGPSNFYVLRSVWKDMKRLHSWMESDLFREAHDKFEGSLAYYFKENELFFHEGIEAAPTSVVAH